MDALRAVELDPKRGSSLESLAAAYAESGEFDKAVETQEKALKYEEVRTQAEMAAQARLKLYKDGKPHRQPGD